MKCIFTTTQPPLFSHAFSNSVIQTTSRVRCFIRILFELVSNRTRHFRLASRMTGKVYLPMRTTDPVTCQGSSDAIPVNKVSVCVWKFACFSLKSSVLVGGLGEESLRVRTQRFLAIAYVSFILSLRTSSAQPWMRLSALQGRLMTARQNVA